MYGTLWMKVLCSASFPAAHGVLRPKIHRVIADLSHVPLPAIEAPSGRTGTPQMNFGAG